jgi:hypothetical protein
MEVTSLDDNDFFRELFEFVQKHGGKKNLTQGDIKRMKKILANHELTGGSVPAGAIWQPWNTVDE